MARQSKFSSLHGLVGDMSAWLKGLAADRVPARHGLGRLGRGPDGARRWGRWGWARGDAYAWGARFQCAAHQKNAG